MSEHVAQAERTKAFCKKLVELNLLESMKAQFTLESGETASLHGFQAVNRTRLKSLSGEALAELATTDELELLYLHLQSMRNFTALKDRFVQSHPVKASAGAASEPTNGHAPHADESAQLAPEPAAAE